MRSVMKCGVGVGMKMNKSYYCFYCGDKLVRTIADHFDKETGKEVWILGCPKKQKGLFRLFKHSYEVWEDSGEVVMRCYG